MLNNYEVTAGILHTSRVSKVSNIREFVSNQRSIEIYESIISMCLFVALSLCHQARLRVGSSARVRTHLLSLAREWESSSFFSCKPALSTTLERTSRDVYLEHSWRRPWDQIMSIAPNKTNPTKMDESVEASKKRQLPTRAVLATTSCNNHAYRFHFSCELLGRFRRRTKRQIKWYV